MSVLDQGFTEAGIEDVFDSVTLKRGRAYVQEGRVRDLKIEEEGRCLSARVRGSGGNVYDVMVTLHPTKSGLVPLCDCSCPVGTDCKHAAALCLTALAANRAVSVVRPVAPPKKAMRDPEDDWLDSLANTCRSAQPESGMTDAGDKKHLFYLFQRSDRAYYPASEKVLQLVPVTARRLMRGQWSKPTPVEIGKLSRAYSAIGDDTDRTIARLMQGGGDYNGLSYDRAFSFGRYDLSSRMLELLLSEVLATGRCFWESLETQPLALGPARPARMGWTVGEDGTQKPALLFADESAGPCVLLDEKVGWYVDTSARVLGPLRLDAPLAVVSRFLKGPTISAVRVARIAEKLEAKALPVPIAPPRRINVRTRRDVVPTPCLHLFTHTPEGAVVRHLAVLHLDYDGHGVSPADGPDTIRVQTGDQVELIPRNRREESVLLDQLFGQTEMIMAEKSLPGSVRNETLCFFPHVQNRAHWLDFMHRVAPRLQASGWRLTQEEGFADAFPVVDVDAGQDAWQTDLAEDSPGAWWFSLDMGIMVEGQRVPLLPLLMQALGRLKNLSSTPDLDQLSLNGQVYADLPDGRAIALPFDRVRAILATLVELYDQPLNADGSLTVPLDLATAVAGLDSATEARWLGGERLRDLIQRLRTFKAIDPVKPPRTLKATLRPYQQAGLNWLQFLREYGLGGILADDMGLGKTLQTLAHILVEKSAKRLKAPCLIVCPTSLVPNWETEAARFAPSLKIVTLHGKERAALFGDIGKADVVLTTYPLLPRDADVLRPVTWHMIVLDEAQAIKNPTAQATQIVCELQTGHRLCLTGTPIENHLGEAWSHFAFLMPGMLGRHKDFNRRFRIPVEKHNDADRREVLVRRLKPFILRRVKSEVATELPPKTELIRSVMVEGAQRDLYETLRLAMHDSVRKVVAAKGAVRSRIEILTALLKLRQACCDPRLLKLAGAKKAPPGAKLDCLMEMLPEMIEEGRRILLFSQFTSMLDLIKPELDKAGLPYVELRGDTVDRRTPVAAFQNGEVPLFLISLKAGGTGLNLTAADTVIHFDPWWNPAVENQATDRAHRIGQDKPVFVYKLIAKDTVEERILDLQKRKGALAAALLEERAATDAAFVGADLENIDFLFGPSSG